jgi:hypothetical protein
VIIEWREKVYIRGRGSVRNIKDSKVNIRGNRVAGKSIYPWSRKHKQYIKDSISVAPDKRQSDRSAILVQSGVRMRGSKV